jgi:hypothetical protein
MAKNSASEMFILPDGSEDKYWTISLMDCQKSIIKLVGKSIPRDGETLQHFDQIRSTTQPNENFFFAAERLQIPITSNLVIVVFGYMLYNWAEYRNSYVSVYYLIKAKWPDSISATGDEQAKLNCYLMSFQEKLCLLQDNFNKANLHAPQAAALIRRLARLYAARSDKESQLSCLQMAVAFSLYNDPEKRLSWIEEACDLATEGDNIELGKPLLFLALQASLLVGERKPELLSRSLDLCERAILFNAQNPGDAQFMEILGAAISEYRHLNPLGLLFQMVNGTVPDELKEDLAGVLHVLVNNVVKLANLSEFLTGPVMSYLTAVENQRLRLFKQQGNTGAQALWNNWTIDYPGLSRAIPFSDSMLRDPERNKFILTLCHELIHVQTFMGTVGVALHAMRWSLNQMLFSHMPQIERWSDVDVNPRLEVEERLGNDEMLAGMTPNMMTLLMTHQHLELHYKIRVMQEVWSPWFEGVAIFGELAANPKDDTDAFHLVTQVLYNVIDTHLPSFAKKEEDQITETDFVDAVSRAENLYSDAIKGEGHHRLRFYLDSEWRHYLAGYLLIRKIVASWRHQNDRVISGCSAFRVLLVVTKQASREVVPDITMSPSDFKRACIQNFQNFVDSVLMLSSDDINIALDGYIDSAADYGMAVVFDKGRFKRVTLDESMHDQQSEWAAEVAKQGLSVEHIASRYNAQFDAATSTNERYTKYLAIAAESLAKRFSNSLFARRKVMEVALNRLTVLIIGQTTCTFWLIENTRSIALYFRVIESDPSYTFLALPLTEKEFDDIRNEVQRLKYNRLQITRLADMLPTRLEENGSVSGAGENFLVLKYGDWTYTFFGGLKFGSTAIPETVVDPIMMRINPPDTLKYFDWYTSAESPMSKYLLNWMEGVPTWTFNPLKDTGIASAGDEDFTAFRNEFLPMARMLAHGTTGTQDEINRVIYDRVFNDPLIAEQLTKEGLEIVKSVDPLLVSRLIYFLQDSSRFPIKGSIDGLEAIDAVLPGFICESRHGFDVAPIATTNDKRTSNNE